MREYNTATYIGFTGAIVCGGVSLLNYYYDWSNFTFFGLASIGFILYLLIGYVVNGGGENE